MKIKMIWVPRILMIIYIVFLLLSLMFFLLTEKITWQYIVFPLLPIAGLAFWVFAFWYNPLVCGLCFFVLGLIINLFMGMEHFLLDWILVVLPLYLSGFLFLWCWYLERNYTFFDK